MEKKITYKGQKHLESEIKLGFSYFLLSLFSSDNKIQKKIQKKKCEHEKSKGFHKAGWCLVSK